MALLGEDKGNFIQRASGNYGSIPSNTAGANPGTSKPGVMPAGENSANNPYGIDTTRSRYEQAADTNPAQFNSMLDQAGMVKGPYAVDPNQSDAFRQMAGIAQSSDLSPWAKLQMNQNDLATSQQRDQANAQSLGANQQAMQSLQATGGGGNSGAAAFLAGQSQRDQMMANQTIGSQSQQNALGIQSTDAQNKQTLLGQVANTQTGAQAANAQTAQMDTTAANAFGTNRYDQLMKAWAADRTGDAQAAAAGGGGKK